MPWYYANYNQRLGPVSDTEFARLAREKTIKEDTLVWQHGMPDWKSYAEVAPTLPPPDISLPVTGTGTIEPVAPVGLVGQPQRGSLSFAGFWPRVGAALIDFLIIYVLSIFLSKAFGAANIDLKPLLEGNLEQMVVLLKQLALFVFVDTGMRIAYYWYFLNKFEATPGKMALGLKVVRSDGSKLSQGQILGRFFAEIVSKYFTLGFGYLMVAFDSEKRAMHDQMCDTRVVNKQRD